MVVLVLVRATVVLYEEYADEEVRLLLCNDSKESGSLFKRSTCCM